MIKYPVTVAAGLAADIAKTKVTLVVDGAEPVVQEVEGNGATVFVTVPEGANGVVYAQFVDRAGNVSLKSPDARFENASDTTPPDAPAGAPVLGAGETV